MYPTRRPTDHRLARPIGAPRSTLCTVVLCVLAALLAAPLAAQTCPDGWTYYPGPAPETINSLRGVSGFGADDVWAVGSAWDTTLNDTFSLVGHFDGDAWTRVPSPSPGVYSGGGTNVTLYTVGGVSTDDLWALGSYKTVHDSDSFVGFQSFALHWDGTNWTQVETPQTPVGGTGASLYGMEAVATDDVWAVGMRVAPDFGAAVSTVGLVLHWDGSQWTELPPPPIVSIHRNELYDLAVFGPDDILAVGGHSGDGFGPPENPYVVRWDGSEWSLVEGVPAPGLQNFVEDMVAITPDDVWLVGHLYESGSQPYLAHYDGTSWQRLVPEGSWPFAELRAVTARATDDVWAVGVYTETTPPAPGRKLILHYDGTSWTQVPADAEGPLDGTLWDVAALPNGHLWTVGSDSVAAPATLRNCQTAIPDGMIFQNSFESGGLESWSQPGL